MQTVWKWNYQLKERFDLELPIGARFRKLSFAPQTAMWFEIPNTSANSETRHFAIFGTGHAMPQIVKLEYLDTIFVGPLVFHLYEIKGE